jgi:hypothetical protein
MQDSLQDWQHEASTMGDVYKGALCNVAATASSDGEGGLFRPRDPRYLKPCLISTEFSDQSNSNYWLESFLIPHDTFQPLFDRGWVIQERVLAPRTLHFGSEYLLWECRHHRKSEIYPLGVPRRIRSLSNLALGPSQRRSKSEARLYWEEIIREYSECQLTKDGDKLVAMSAIAKEISMLGGWGEYLAGLWGSDILSDLLWVSTHDHKKAKEGLNWPCRPGVYRAPSWSWASIDGPINWPKFPQEPSKPTDDGYMFVTFLSATIDHATSDLYGEVRSAELRLAGPLGTFFLATRSFYDDGEGEGALDDNDNDNDGDEDDDDDDKDEDTDDDGLSSRQIGVLSNQSQSFILESSGGDTKNRTETTWNIYFDVGRHQYSISRDEHIHYLIFCRGKGDKEAEHCWWGLLLQPTGIRKGQFRRIGILHLYTNLANPPWLNEVDLLDDRKGRSRGEYAPKDPGIDWLEYEEFDGKNYTVSVI